MPIRRDRRLVGVIIRNLYGRTAVNRYLPKLRVGVSININDPLPVGREARIQVVVAARQLLRVSAVNVNAPDVALSRSSRSEDYVAPVG